MKRICSMLFLASLLVLGTVTFAFASTVSNDDPERCGEHGSSVHRIVGAAMAPASASRTPVTPPPVAPVRKTVPVVAARKPVAKPARVVPNANAPAPPTPGMGILLKMSNGATGGEATWSPSKPNDNTNPGASWIL